MKEYKIIAVLKSGKKIKSIMRMNDINIAKNYALLLKKDYKEKFAEARIIDNSNEEVVLTIK